MKRLSAVGLVAMMAFTGGPSVLAQNAPPTPEEQARNAVEMRQGLLKLMGWNMAPLGGMMKNQVPFDAAVALKSAERMAALSEMIPDAFQSDTRKFNIKTGALEGIWNSKADFNAKAADMNKALAGLVAAAKTGEKGATIKAAGAVGKACGSCHDTFRAK